MSIENNNSERNESIGQNEPVEQFLQKKRQHPTISVILMNKQISRLLQLCGKRRSLIIAALLVILGVIPLLAFILISWSGAHSATSPTPFVVVQQSSRTEVIPQAIKSTRMISQVDSLVQSQLSQQQFTGSVLVAVGNQVVLARGYGLADDTSQIENTADTRFFLGSVTKEFTATAILFLQQEGKLRVQNLLCTYLVACSDSWQSITVKEVLMHTSGIPGDGDVQLPDDTPENWIAAMASQPLEFAPGTQFDYCSVCYQVLAYVVQHVSGEPYSDFVQKMILNPLHMKRSGFDSDAYYSQPAAATGYASWQVPAEQLGWSMGPQWSFLDGSGLLYSTARDLFLWDQALYTNILLPQSVLHTAFTPYVNAAELFPGSDYGYGWFITQSPVAGHRLIWHDGAIDGFRNYIGRYVDDHVTIITLSNLATVDPVAFAQSIQKVVFANLT